VGVSRDNIELARRAYEAFSRGDLQAALDFIDADVEIHEGQDLPDGGVYRRHQGFLANVSAWSEVFAELRFEPEDFVDAGDRLLVLVRVSGRGKASGAEFEQRQAHVWTVRDGKGVRLEFFSDRAEAERAVGLRVNR
jgi:ketosteroid isomerase-like protein